MSEKSIIYLYDACGLSLEEIALQSKLTIDQVKAIISRPDSYPLDYVPRNRYNGWVYGK